MTDMHDNEPTASGIDLPRILAEVARRDGDRHAPRPMVREPVAGSFPKRCACGAVYDRADWEALRWDGVQDCGGECPDYELRRCHCGSSPSVDLEEVVS